MTLSVIRLFCIYEISQSKSVRRVGYGPIVVIGSSLDFKSI